MTSKSRIAQQALTELEKSSAAFEDQLIEAAKFIGIDDIETLSIGRNENVETSRKKRKGALSSHGKEEWLLKWLLKKLQNPKDDIPRQMPRSWLILRCLLERLSISSSAKILVERKFLSVLQTTLEEAKQRPVENELPTTNGEVASVKASKKRKRSSAVQEESRSDQNSGKSLLVAVLTVLDYMVQSTRAGSVSSSEARGSEYAAEYMRTVLRGSAEDAAKILGSWLSLLKKHGLLKDSVDTSSIGAFVEIWHLRTADENSLTHFSLHCTLPLLALRTSLGDAHHMGAELEQLIARNIILPSKAARSADKESTLFADLTRIAVISDSNNASYLFDVTIRSVQPQGLKRRLSTDEDWLKAVFNSLVESMPRVRAEQNRKALCAMLASAIQHRVTVDLSVLRSLTQEFALDTATDSPWELLHLVIKLDANVFLIPNEGEQDLLQQLLDKIKQESDSSVESDVSTQVVDGVVIPLMAAFSKARDLTGFVHHWHAQLHNSNKASLKRSAWTDSKMQEALKTLLQSSLSVQQVVQLLDWLDQQFAQYPTETLVILQAVSGSISQEEYIDAVGSRCYQIIFDKSRNAVLENSSSWRALRILANTFTFTTAADRDELAELWSSGAQPFGTLTAQANAFQANIQTEIEAAIELWKLGCDVWNVAKDGSKLQEVARPFVSTLLKSMASTLQIIRSQTADNDVKSPSKLAVLESVQYMLIECPEMLILASSLEKTNFREMIDNIFKAMSSPTVAASANGDAQESFALSWLKALQQDCVLNDSQVTDIMIDVMLDAVDSESTSAKAADLAIRSLLQLPMAVMHRRHRERIIASWHSNNSESLNPAILALKVKIMRFPMFYEGMVFRHIVDMATRLDQSSRQKLLAHVAILKQLAHLTFDFILTNVDQPRNQEYIKDAFAFASKKVKRLAEKENQTASVGVIVLLDIVLGALRSHTQILLDANVAKDKDIKKVFARAETGLLKKLQGFLEAISDQDTESNQDIHCVVLLDALDVLELRAESLESSTECIDIIRKASVNSGLQLETAVRNRLDTFVAAHQRSEQSDLTQLQEFSCSSTPSRKAIVHKADIILQTASVSERMRSLKVSLSTSSEELAQLLAIRHLLISSEDVRKKSKRKDSDSDSSDEDAPEDIFDLSEAYSLLCAHLPRASSVRQFSVISETLTTMLRTKARSITQWNIDSTLGAITTICSRHGPALRSSRASTIYLHLCHLFQAVLTSHRLKLEGHFHLVVQALQALLRCLFIPLPHSSTKVLKANVPPPWLSVTPHTYLLNATHATAFTRLVTLICDPSVSSVTHRSKNNALTSATDKAKRMAGQHMVFILMGYVKLQLDMKMIPGMREQMTPGLYAIFDTTTMESRRAVSEALDTSGRAVFGVLYRDYLKFGKWKGS